MNLNQEMKQAIRKMTMWDWGLVKLSCMLFGFMIATLFPEIRELLDWYWWMLIAILLWIPMLTKIYKIKLPKPTKRKVKGKNGEWIIAYDFKVAKKKAIFWDWGVVKLGITLFGIGIATLFTTIIQVPWYYWGIGVIITAAIPIYFIYFYTTPKKATAHSKARAKYSRRKKSPTFKYMYKRSPDYSLVKSAEGHQRKYADKIEKTQKEYDQIANFAYTRSKKRTTKVEKKQMAENKEVKIAIRDMENIEKKARKKIKKA